MSSAAITDYHFSGSNDYESLLNNCSSSSSTASSPNGANERHTEKRAKSNTVINKIRRFARSQSQIRHGSRGHDYINSENLVSKTKDLYRDVKRRFSSFNTNSLESDKRSSSTTCKSVLPSARTSSNLKANCESDSRSTLICETIQPTTVSRLRRYASDESLPTSESGCGSSVKTSSFSTDSNRSSICTVNDFSNEYSVFKGPFIGQGIALADCTPCPYDKDALVFKKGDLVNIIAKNDSGTWIGMANGKIGHFKFINVEEISSLSNGMRPTYSSFCSASSTTLTSTNGAIEGDKSCSNVNASNVLDVSEGVSLATGSTSSSTTTINNFSSSSAFLSNHYEDIIRNLLSSVNIYLDNSLKGLFKLIGLDGYDYLTKLREKGFSSLGSLMNITDPSILEIVGITCPDHQQTILSIASIVRKLAHSMPDNQIQSKAIEINKLETHLASMSVDVDVDRPVAQSAPTTPAFESFQKTLSFVLNTSSNVKEKQFSSVSSQEPNNPDESNKCNPSSAPLKEVKNFATTITVTSNGDEPPSALRLRKKRDRRSSETSDNIKRAASGNDILDDDLYSKYRFSSFDHRKSLDTNALVKKLEHGYETRTSHYGDISSNKMLSSSKSVFDLKYNENTNLEESNVHGGHFTKKRLKKLLNPSDRKSISTISFDDHRRIGVTSRPLSSALLDTLSNILTEENIDLTIEPYSDASGFCGIPPALVQRYAEELETDIYDIAETLDYIRLCSLLNKAGRQGIPNDFLADSCNGPGTDLANYENIHNWLLSLGLPMYETKLADNGFKSLWDMMSLREDDLINCGIINKRHLRSLTTAISALSVNQHKIGKA